MSLKLLQICNNSSGRRTRERFDTASNRREAWSPLTYDLRHCRIRISLPSSVRHLYRIRGTQVKLQKSSVPKHMSITVANSRGLRTGVLSYKSARNSHRCPELWQNIIRKVGPSDQVLSSLQPSKTQLTTRNYGVGNSNNLQVIRIEQSGIASRVSIKCNLLATITIIKRYKSSTIELVLPALRSSLYPLNPENVAQSDFCTVSPYAETQELKCKPFCLRSSNLCTVLS